jgi:hypothetical protein
VDSSTVFEVYKIDKQQDITFDYFEHYDNVESNMLIGTTHIDYYQTYQYNNYHLLDYQRITPVVEKYFTPSRLIKYIIENIEQKYRLDYENTCVLFYRGNDKVIETQLCEYSDYVTYAYSILQKNPNIKFLIQSDETEFIEYFTILFPNNSFYFKDEIRHMTKRVDTVDKVFSHQNNMYSKYYLAITIIMSRCEHVVCGSGNCSIWIMLYRGNSHNVYQYNQSMWLCP